ncbi:MAG: hypothetical protein I8H75_06240 [Myxococcaceae bacterium]|nr:hypothetical protein [Myxococcaceae bacterium]
MKYGLFFSALASLQVAYSLAEPLPCAEPFPMWEVVARNHLDLPPPAIPPQVTESAKTGAAVSTLLGTVTAVGLTQVAQNARTGLTLGILACDDRLPAQTGALDWQDSPTRIALGSDDLQYHAGAVLGNWALLLGISSVWGAVAYRIGVFQAHLPGSLILPVLFLISPTTTSSVSLMRQGDASQKTLGACSLIATLVGVGAAGVPTLPWFFRAHWEIEEREWVDVWPGSGWVDRYGELFDTYGPARQGYIIAELFTSVTVGVLKSYQSLQADCSRLLWVAAGVYDAYALSQIGLRPNRNPHVQYFFSGIAGLQALALTTQAIASVAASEETQQQVRSVTQWVVVATEYLMMVKTLFDIGLRVKNVYDGVFVKKPLPEPASLTKPLLEEPSMDLPLDLLGLSGGVELESRSSSRSSSASSSTSTIPAIQALPKPLKLSFEKPTIREIPEPLELPFTRRSTSEHYELQRTQINGKLNLAEEISQALGLDSTGERNAL